MITLCRARFINFIIIACVSLLATRVTSKFNTSNLMPQIALGSQATPGQFPHHVAITSFDAQGQKLQFCGGSIITSKIVLTAAECTYGASKFELQFGSIDINAMLVNVITSDFVVYPKYAISAIQYIALIGMRNPLVFNQYIYSIAIAKSFTKPGVRATVTGFGSTSLHLSSPSQYLLYANMITISDRQCKYSYSILGFPDTICADGYCPGQGTGRCTKRRKGSCNINNPPSCALQDVCYGDLGGALFVTDSDGRRTQIGVVFYAGVCESSAPSIYIELARFYKWIQKNVDCYSAGSSFCP